MRTALLGSLAVLLLCATLAGAGTRATKEPYDYSPSRRNSRCVTGDEAFVTPTLAGAKEMRTVITSRDKVAWQQLFAEKKVARLPPGVPVYIMDDDVYGFFQVRLEGQTDTVWISKDDLKSCRNPRQASDRQ
jgi:hypothetical protein